MKIYPPENYYQTFGYFPFFISPVINKRSPDNVYRNKNDNIYSIEIRCIGKQRALSLDIRPIPTIGTIIGYFCV